MSKILLPLLCMLGLLSWSLPLQAQTQGAPQYRDLRNKVAKPDLQSVTRLRFVTTTDFPPFNFIDATGRLSGYHLDLARALCAALNRQDACQIEAKNWNELAQTLESGEAEAVLAGLTPTEETRQTYLFSKPFFTLPARFVSKTETTFDPATREKEKIGVLEGSAHQALLAQQFAQFEAVPFPDQAALFSAIQEDRVDAVFGDGMRLSFWLGSAGSQGCCGFVGAAYAAPDFLGYGLSIATSREQPRLQAAFEYALSELARDGTLDALYRKYFPVGFY